MMTKVDLIYGEQRLEITPYSIPETSVLTPVEYVGEAKLDRFANDGMLKDVQVGDFVWCEGAYGELTIPRAHCEVIRGDEFSVTVRLPLCRGNNNSK